RKRFTGSRRTYYEHVVCVFAHSSEKWIKEHRFTRSNCKTERNAVRSSATCSKKRPERSDYRRHQLVHYGELIYSHSQSRLPCFQLQHLTSVQICSAISKHATDFVGVLRKLFGSFRIGRNVHTHIERFVGAA